MEKRRTNLIWGIAALASSGLCVSAAVAEDKPANTLGLGGYWDTIQFSGHVEAGVTLNPDQPARKINFGHLFTDKANIPLLNQLMGTVERPLDLKAPGYDFGFKIQAFYGSDARYTHFTYEGDDITDARNQLDLVEANVQAHTPWLSEGGIDFKLGQYATQLGADVIPAPGNFFYSHSYIFQFGIPFKHTGGYATVHALPWLDLYAGGDAGANTAAFGGDTNNEPAFLGAIGLTLLEGTLTIFGAAHVGPELGTPARVFGFRPDDDIRQMYDVVVTWKITDALTSMTEFNYIRDNHNSDLGASSGGKAWGGGIAQYLTYKLNDQFAIGGRGEVWRGDGFLVAAFPNNRDFLDVEKGKPTQVSIVTQTAKYLEFTLGVNYKPFTEVKYLEGFTLRPEVRYDRAFDTPARPYDNTRTGAGTDNDQWTFGIDFILPF